MKKTYGKIGAKRLLFGAVCLATAAVTLVFCFIFIKPNGEDGSSSGDAAAAWADYPLCNGLSLPGEDIDYYGLNTDADSVVMYFSCADSIFQDMVQCLIDSGVSMSGSADGYAYSGYSENRTIALIYDPAAEKGSVTVVSESSTN